MTILYSDQCLTCDEDGITIFRYYFPAGSKRIRYAEISGFYEYTMGPSIGHYRLWGSGAAWTWFHYDPDRTSKTVAISLDLGGFIHPNIPPRNSETVLAIVNDKIR